MFDSNFSMLGSLYIPYAILMSVSDGWGSYSQTLQSIEKYLRKGLRQKTKRVSFDRKNSVEGLVAGFLIVELSPSSYLQRKQARKALGIMVYKQLALKVIDNVNCYDTSISGERSWNSCSIVLKALFPCWLQESKVFYPGVAHKYM